LLIAACIIAAIRLRGGPIPSPKLTAVVSEALTLAKTVLRELERLTNNVTNYDVNAVRLQQAVLCVDCDVISDSPHANCMICGSRSLLPLARVLDAPERTALLAATQQQEARSEGPAQVLVLVPSIPHRNRQRAHPRG